MPEEISKDEFDDKSIKVEISKDEKKAWLKITQGEKYTVKALEEALNVAGVFKGVIRERLEKAAEGARLMGSEPIATYIPPSEGASAQIRYLISHEVKPLKREDGSLDFREINLIRNIAEGDLLARKIPAEKGEPGYKVTGLEIEGIMGKDVNLRNIIGQGAAISTEDENLIIAEIDGVYKKQKNGSVSVLGSYEVKGDVDYSTGNIRSNSSVTVSGDVKAGFEVKCSGDLTVKGLIEDANCEVGGDLMVSYGLTKGESQIIVEDEIKAKYMYSRAKVIAGNIVIYEMIQHSHVVVDGNVKAGKIVGGEIIAKGDIECKDAGSDRSETKTLLTAGLDLEKMEERTRLISMLEAKNIDLEKLQEEHEKLKVWADDFKKNSEKMLKEISQITNPTISKRVKDSLKDKIKKLHGFANAIKDIKTEIKDLEDQINVLNKELANPKAKIKISGTVFAGVKITIGESDSLIIQNKEERVTFRLDSNRQIMRAKF